MLVLRKEKKRKLEGNRMAINVVVKVVAVPMGEAINGGRFDDFNLF